MWASNASEALARHLDALPRRWEIKVGIGTKLSDVNYLFFSRSFLFDTSPAFKNIWQCYSKILDYFILSLDITYTDINSENR